MFGLLIMGYFLILNRCRPICTAGWLVGNFNAHHGAKCIEHCNNFKYLVDVLCRFGAVILAFFFSSSQLTKYKSEVKKNVEEDFKPGGQRDW